MIIKRVLPLEGRSDYEWELGRLLGILEGFFVLTQVLVKRVCSIYENFDVHQ